MGTGVADVGLTQLIREVLAEELARVKRERAHRPENAPREELVAIASDDDLRAFAERLLKLAGDGAERRDFEEGRLLFRLAGGRPSPGTTPAAATTEAATRIAPRIDPRIDSGFLSERQVDALPKDTKRLVVGKAVRLTPLARDRLRQRGIEIERTGS